MRVLIQEEVLEIRSRVVGVKRRRETILPHAVRKLLTFLPEKILESVLFTFLFLYFHPYSVVFLISEKIIFCFCINNIADSNNMMKDMTNSLRD